MFKPGKQKISVLLGMGFLCVIVAGIFVTGFAAYKLSAASDQQKLTHARLGDLQSLQSLKDNVSQQTALLLGMTNQDNLFSFDKVAREFASLQQVSNTTTQHFRGLINGAKNIPGINLKEVDEASSLLQKIENAAVLLSTETEKIFRLTHRLHTQP